ATKRRVAGQPAKFVSHSAERMILSRSPRRKGRTFLVGKHEAGYARVERDSYPTPTWVVAALAEHVGLAGLRVWEPACGDGRMVEALRRYGCIYTSDIADTGAQHEVFDFLSARSPELERFDAIITNPPFGQGGKLATAFIEAGLKRLDPGG